MATVPYWYLVGGREMTNTINRTGGTWARVAREGWGSVIPMYTYLFLTPKGYVQILSEVWVDGRYVGVNEVVQWGTEFKDKPNADFILLDYTFKDSDGEIITADVYFHYYSYDDCWRASDYSNSSYEVKLTREEVEKLDLDSQTNRHPERGVIYDGTAYPGTFFENVPVTGVSLPEQVKLCPGAHMKLVAEVKPAQATCEVLWWSSSDSSVVYTDDGVLYARGEGTAVVTAVTADGGFTASCTVTVGHNGVTVPGVSPSCTQTGLTEGVRCSDCQKVLVEQKPVDMLDHAYENGICTGCGANDPEYKPEIHYGDCNGDGRINTVDLVVLRQYLANWGTEIDQAASDVNCDGRINTVDLVILRQYLANWDVTLGN